MKTGGVPLLKQLGLLLAVLLCSLQAIAAPAAVQAPAQTPEAESTFVQAPDAPVAFLASEPVAEAVAVLAVDKALLTPLVQYFIKQLYPQACASPAPALAASYGHNIRAFHKILTKGP